MDFVNKLMKRKIKRLNQKADKATTEKEKEKFINKMKALQGKLDKKGLSNPSLLDKVCAKYGVNRDVVKKLTMDKTDSMLRKLGASEERIAAQRKKYGDNL